MVLQNLVGGKNLATTGKFLAISLGIFAFCLPAVATEIRSYDFEIFTQNGQYWNDSDVKLSVSVTGEGNMASFRFYNNSLVDCIIAEIYFDDGSLLGIDSIVNGPGVLFTRDINSKNLPGAKDLDPDFVADREFTTGADNPAPQNGVSNVTVPTKDWVQINFDLTGNQTVSAVYNELANGELRIGMHVVSFPDGSSNSVLVKPSGGQVVPEDPSIPEPASLFLLSLGGYTLLRRRSS